MAQYSTLTGLTATAYADDMFSGLVVEVLDGDTIKIKDYNKILVVRLYGIDAPEKKQRYGQNAKKFTSNMVLNKKVMGISYGKGRYGRVIASIYLKKKSLSEELLKNGFAWVYLKYCKANFCTNWSEIQRAAKRNKIGLWQDKNPLAPWKFRHRKSKSLNTKGYNSIVKIQAY
jgi:endonuclease YncB( thermonuclease family)